MTKQKLMTHLNGSSISEKYTNGKEGSAPLVSSTMAKSVSISRRQLLENEVQAGLFKDGSSNNYPKDYDVTPASNVTATVGGNSSFKKQAQVQSSGNYRGGNDTVKQMPEVYSPLWLNSNINFPRDRATINAWCRSFYALNPFVHNAINLHSTYPISKLNITCPNKDIEKFFNDMIEEIDLMNICVQIAQEFWLLGEAFIYAELDENKGKWSRLLIQNPDYMIVKRTAIADDPIIMLKPDPNLVRIVNSNKPSDMEQKKQLNSQIIDSVRRGQNIPLDSYNISHLSRKISPYEIRGTGLPVCIFRNLMLFDKIRECYSDDTEVLTDQGFKKINEIIEFNDNKDLNYFAGVFVDSSDKLHIANLSNSLKIACVNPDTDQIEYHKPHGMVLSNYNGKMLHFSGKFVDTLVTPNHKMWASKKEFYKYNNFKKIKASEFVEKSLYKFKTTSNYKGKDIENVNVIGHNVPIDLYLKFLGHVISEGCIDTSFNKNTKQYRNRTSICQSINSPYFAEMKSVFEDFAKCISKNTCSEIKPKENHQTLWNGTISSKELNNYLIDTIGINNNCNSFNKQIPRWILELDVSYLKIILNSLMQGDGSKKKLKNNKLSFRYTTVSKMLADNVQELVFKCGYSAFISADKRPQKSTYEYTVRWSDSKIGSSPIVCNSKSKKTRTAKIKEIDYNGAVWCLEVPTGLFITRRNNRISIHGNSKFAQADNMINPLTLVKIGSEGQDGLHPTHADLDAWREVFEMAQYDKDFKIFTHPGVTVERVGYNQGIYDTSGDITQLVKEIYIGLMVPSAIMDGGADTTYANAGVALDLLRQRYMQFRNMLSIWLKRKIFAPISKLQNFYDYSNGEKKLIVPEIDWNHMSLFDTNDYITNLVTLTQGDSNGKRASLHDLYRSLGLDWNDTQRKLRKEAIQEAIMMKEKAALATLDLNALRALTDEDEIPEPEAVAGGPPSPGETPVPGEMPPPDLSGGNPPGGAPPPPPPPPPG